MHDSLDSFTLVSIILYELEIEHSFSRLCMSMVEISEVRRYAVKQMPFQNMASQHQKMFNPIQSVMPFSFLFQIN